MPTYDDSAYKTYTLHSVPPAVFGQTYVIVVGIHTSGPYYKGEYHILTQRPTPAVESFSWRFEQLDEHKDMLQASIGWMQAESLTFARSRLVERLEQRAEQLNAPHILANMLELGEVVASPFPSCRLLGMFHGELDSVQRATECKELSRYLAALRQIPAMISR